MIFRNIPIKHFKSLAAMSLADEDWHMPFESFQYFIILFRVNQVFTFYHFIGSYVPLISFNKLISGIFEKKRFLWAKMAKINEAHLHFCP